MIGQNRGRLAPRPENQVSYANTSVPAQPSQDATSLKQPAALWALVLTPGPYVLIPS